MVRDVTLSAARANAALMTSAQFGMNAWTFRPTRATLGGAVSALELRALECAQESPAHTKSSRMLGPDEERALMAAYANGDDRAFSPLFEAFAPRLLGFFRRSFSDSATAEDLVQMTFVRLHAGRSSYERGAPVRPWLFTIAARVRIDELRRRYRLPESADDAEFDRFEAPRGVREGGEQLDQDARDRAVREAVDALPASQRVIVHLHRFEGLTFAEIGQSLGVKEGTVRVRAFRAYEALRVKLKPLVEQEVVR